MKLLSSRSVPELAGERRGLEVRRRDEPLWPRGGSKITTLVLPLDDAAFLFGVRPPLQRGEFPISDHCVVCVGSRGYLAPRAEL